MKIDNYALNLFQVCPEKYRLRIKKGYTSRRKSAALGFGLAFHAGLAGWYRTKSRVEMTKAVENAWPDGMPVDDFRTKQKCIETLLAYTKEYPDETFQFVQGTSGPLIEVPFTLHTGLYLPCSMCWTLDISGKDDPLCSECHSLKEPIEYGGIFDGMVHFSGTLYVLEHKTTSQLGDSYFDQFRPNNQVTGYVWGGSGLSGQRVGGAFINAIGVYKSSAPKFKRQVTVRSEEEIAEWLKTVYADCVEIRRYERMFGVDTPWPMRTNACTTYGKCEYHRVHSMPHQKQRLVVLDQDYVQDYWDFEGRDE